MVFEKGRPSRFRRALSGKELEQTEVGWLRVFLEGLEGVLLRAEISVVQLKEEDFIVGRPRGNRDTEFIGVALVHFAGGIVSQLCGDEILAVPHFQIV
jgi:hypothetical protein